MSTPATNLIEEEPIRAALAPLRLDGQKFKARVERRVANELVKPTEEHTVDRSPWLSLAASICPLPVLGVTKFAPISFSQLPLGAKLVGVVAWPVASLVMVLASTALGAWLMRTVQAGGNSQTLDDKAAGAIVARWWTRYGALPVILSGTAVVSAIYGFAVPVLTVLLASGAAMVMLVSRLAAAGTISRGQLAGLLAAPLGSLSQLLFIFLIIDSGTHLLDQSLMIAVVYLGVGAVSLVGLSDRNDATLHLRLRGIAMLGFGAAILCSGSLAWPTTDQSIVRHVESFDYARHSSASWAQWAIPAKWLSDQGHMVDLSKPRKLLETELADEQNPFILGSAFRGGLIDELRAARIKDLDKAKDRLLADDDRVLSLEQREPEIHALVLLGMLTEADRNHLEQRLLLTIDQTPDQKIHGLDDPLVAVELLEAIGRRLKDPRRHESLRTLIQSFQRLSPRLGNRPGGFASYNTTEASDDRATAAAVHLMQHVGAPEEIDWLALRSCLRPSWKDLVIGDQAIMRTAIRQRLNALPDVPPLSWWDYVRCEQPLIMSVLLVGTCVLAVLGAPTPGRLEA